MGQFEVQTCFGDHWENCWSEDVPGDHIGDGETKTVMQTFETHDLAMAAIYEFFADLSRAGMAQSYLLEDYRVVRTDAVSHQ